MAGGRRRWTPFERDLRTSVGPLIAGVDEVGRGPLAGPVVACAVVMPPDERAIPGVDDSKRLPPRERERLAVKIRARALSVALGAASVREIDRVNIYHATVIAMRRALKRLSVAPHHVLVDGRPIRTLDTAHTAIVGGDARCYSIACASIIAKVTRDRIMHALARRHPAYDWLHNVGYGTANHAAGLASAGSCSHHRTSFLVRRRQFELGLGAEVIDSVLLDELMLEEVVFEDAAESENLSVGPLADPLPSVTVDDRYPPLSAEMPTRSALPADVANPVRSATLIM